MMLTHMIDFLVDFFTNLNAKKIFGGILVLIGLAILGRIVSAGLISGDANVGVLYAAGGILVGGVGLVIIYYDMAKDKTSSGHSEIDTISKAYEQKAREDLKTSGWHMNQNPGHENTPKKD